MVLTGVISSLSARNGITTLATAFLQFKAEQLVTYAQGQWNLLAANGLESTPDYLDASKAANSITFAASGTGVTASGTGRLAGGSGNDSPGVTYIRS